MPSYHPPAHLVHRTGKGGGGHHRHGGHGGRRGGGWGWWPWWEPYCSDDDPHYPPCRSPFQITGAAGQAVTKKWTEIQADSSGTFQVRAGERYAALVSVSRNFSKADLATFLQKRGWDVTYLWEWGDPNRGTYQIDDWLAAIPQDTRENHRWVYGEANLTRDDSFGKDSPCILFVCTTVYHVAVAYWAKPVADGGPQPVPTVDPGPPPPRPQLTVGGFGKALIVLGVGAAAALLFLRK